MAQARFAALVLFSDNVVGNLLWLRGDHPIAVGCYLGASLRACGLSAGQQFSHHVRACARGNVSAEPLHRYGGGRLRRAGMAYEARRRRD